MLSERTSAICFTKQGENASIAHNIDSVMVTNFMIKPTEQHNLKGSFPVLHYNAPYYLREQRLSDAPHFLEYYNDKAVSQYILTEIPNTIALAEKEIQYCRSLFYNRTGLYWSLAIKSCDTMIGAIGYYTKQVGEAEICYDLHKEYWNAGIMTQALTQAIQYGRDQMQLNTINAITLKENTASTRLLLKLGFKHEQTLRQHRYFQGQFYDVEKYTLHC